VVGSRRLSPPGAQCVGVHSRADIVAEQRDLFAQVELRRELRHGLLPRAHCVRGRGGAEPVGQRPFTRACPGDTQQLEQRSAPEDVEILSVGVVRVPKALSRLSPPHPAPLQTREPRLVERDGALAVAPATELAIVDDDQHDERRRGDREPAARHDFRPEGQPRRDDTRGEDSQAQVRDESGPLPPALGRRAPGHQPAGVLGVGRGGPIEGRTHGL